MNAPRPALDRSAGPVPASTRAHGVPVRVASPAARPALALHIDRVVLDGRSFGPRDRALLHAALQTELAALLTEQGPGAALQCAVALPSLGPGRLDATPDADPAALGRAIARALHREIAR